MNIYELIILQLRTIWCQWRNHVHHYERQFQHLNHLTHLSYFGMVMTHGPYHWAAGVLLFLGILGFLLHLGEIE